LVKCEVHGLGSGTMIRSKILLAAVVAS